MNWKLIAVAVVLLGGFVFAGCLMLTPEQGEALEGLQASYASFQEHSAKLKAKAEEITTQIQTTLQAYKDGKLTMENSMALVTNLLAQRDAVETELKALVAEGQGIAEQIAELKALGVPTWLIWVKNIWLGVSTIGAVSGGAWWLKLQSVSRVLGVVCRAADASGVDGEAPAEMKAGIVKACTAGEATTAEVRTLHHLAAGGAI